MTASDEDIYSLNGKISRGFELLSSHLVAYISHDGISSTKPVSILCIFYNFFHLPIFTTPQGLVSGFIFIYNRQFLHHFNFISFSHFHSVFCFVFFHLITKFEQHFYIISGPRSQIRALHFCSFQFGIE